MKTSKELLREFYVYFEQNCHNNFKLDAVKSAYFQIKTDLDVLDELIDRIDLKQKKIKHLSPKTYEYIKSRKEK